VLVAADAVRVGAGQLDDGRLDRFYWILGVVNFVVFLAFARRHEYKGTPAASTAAARLEKAEVGRVRTGALLCLSTVLLIYVHGACLESSFEMDIEYSRCFESGEKKLLSYLPFQVLSVNQKKPK
jgi:hypothetical protein